MYLKNLRGSFNQCAIASSYERFRSVFDKVLEDGVPKHVDHKGVAHVKNAIFENAFETGAFELQALYGKDGVKTNEMLYRLKQGCDIELISKTVVDLGVSAEFDGMVVLVALSAFEKSDDVVPVSINASVESVLDPDYWDQVLPYMQKYGCEYITIEILENDVPENADASFLKQIKDDNGFHFALDDMTLSDRDIQRLETFGGLVNEIKIDGPVVRAYLEDGFHEKNTAYAKGDLVELIALIKRDCPDAIIVAERVYNKQEADQLFQLGVAAVQGRDLKRDDFKYTCK